MPYYLYILRCNDGSLYIGHTSDLSARVLYHNAGQGAQFTRLRRPVHLVYQERFEAKLPAVLREKQVKCWSRAKKEALVCGDLEALKSASRHRS